MKKLLLILLLLPAFVKAQFCGPYTIQVPLSLSGVSNTTIHDKTITVGTAAGIYLYNCHNVHIYRNYFHDGSTVNGIAIWAVNCTNITIDSNYFERVSTGAEIQNSSGIIFNYNRARNMLGPYPRGQMVQFNNVSGAGNAITNNISWSDPGIGNYEDHINVYKSNGIAGSPIMVTGNKIYGGGPSVTGSGITVADQGGSYQTIMNNIVVNSGNVGMQVAGGTFINMNFNTIYSKPTTISHLGLGYGNFTSPQTPSNNINMGQNTVQWKSSKPADLAFYPKGTTVIQKDTSHQKGTPEPTNWRTNTTNAAIDSTILSFPLWPSCTVLPNITYTPSTIAATYGVAITPISPTNSGGPISNYTISPALPAGLTFNISTGTIQGTPTALSGSTTYTVTAFNSGGTGSITITIVVNKAPLLISVNNRSKTVGDVNPTLTVSYFGFNLGQTSAVLTSGPTVVTTALTGSPIGTYPITASGATATNYAITYSPGNLYIYATGIRISRRFRY